MSSWGEKDIQYRLNINIDDLDECKRHIMFLNHMLGMLHEIQTKLQADRDEAAKTFKNRKLTKRKPSIKNADTQTSESLPSE